jgi:putative ABC transport system ATP-binding protein
MKNSNNKFKNPLFFFKIIFGSDKRFLLILLGYSVAVSILSLALPISIQSLINSITNTAMVPPLFTLALGLLILLGLSSVINAMQAVLTEQFQQQFFARMVTEISLRCSYASYTSFEAMNKSELMNKFFEIITVQKSVPYLMTGIFFISLQTLVGIIISSLYHPIYFIFNIFLVSAIYIGLRWHHQRATEYAIAESSKKHSLASWLQEIGRSHHLFKSKMAKQYASKKSASLIQNYLTYRKLHFKHLFSQISFLLVLYTVSNSALLFISGYLVLKGQLTLGQLVATEVIFSSIFVNFYKAGNYLESYYDIVASTDKLNYFFDLELEEPKGSVVERPVSISFKDSVYAYKSDLITLNYSFKPGKRYLIKTNSSSLKKLFTDIIHGYVSPKSGFVFLNQLQMSDLDIHRYRDHVGMVDSDGLLECTIGEYLSFSNEVVNEFKLIEALKTVDLYDSLKSQGFDFDTPLHPSGHPLSRTDSFKLKMAKCVLDNPSIVMLNDYITEFTIKNKFLQDWIHQFSPEAIIIFLESGTHPDFEFDYILQLDPSGLHEISPIGGDLIDA